jgi:pSer/pThr/pTyr-binding forkhead associated (FHA) protein
MDARHPSDIQATGTLPLSGADSVPVAAASAPEPKQRPAWVKEARDGVTVPGKYLAYEESSRHVVVPLAQEWTRIGRSLAADIRFDDATVSRRHALVVSQAEGVRVLDDRSLNGIYVNGNRVEWSSLTDGDEVTIGRHALHYIDAATVGSNAPQQAAVAE